jgi:hypothetical protein
MVKASRAAAVNDRASDRDAAPPASLTAANTVRKFDKQIGSENLKPGTDAMLSKICIAFSVRHPSIVRALSRRYPRVSDSFR